MSTYTAPDKIEDIANELRKYSRCVENCETNIYRIILNLINEIEAEYNESYVRSKTQHIRQMLDEIRKSADKATGKLKLLSSNTQKAAFMYRNVEKSQIHKLRRNIKSFNPNLGIIKTLKGIYKVIIKNAGKTEETPKFDVNKDYAALIHEAIEMGDYSNLQTLVDERDAKIASNKDLYKDVNTTGEDLLSYGYVGVISYLNSLGYENNQISYENGKACVTVNGKRYTLDILGIALTGSVNYASKENIKKALNEAKAPAILQTEKSNESTSAVCPEGKVGKLEVRKLTAEDIYKIPEKYANDKYLKNLTPSSVGDWSYPEKVIFNSEEIELAQTILAKLGFDVGSADGAYGIKTAHAIILFQYATNGTINGMLDEATMNRLKNYNEFSTSDEKIREMNDKLKDWKLVPCIKGENGKADTSEFVVIPALGSEQAFLPKEAAIGWAMMVRGVLNDKSLSNPSKTVEGLYPQGPNSGYRTYNEQYKFHVDYYIAMRYEVAQGKCGGVFKNLIDARNRCVEDLYRGDYGDKVTFDQLTEAEKDNACQKAISRRAAYPGSSKHGYGGAIDFNINTGDSLHNWLKKNAKKYKFTPLAGEDWHWNYSRE